MTLLEEINYMKVDLYSFAERHSKVVDIYEAEKKADKEEIERLKQEVHELKLQLLKPGSISLYS